MNAKQKANETLGKGGTDAAVAAADRLRAGTQAFLDEQANALDAAQSHFMAWTKRRQEGMESAIRLTQKAGACKDFASVLGVYGEWMEGSLDRVRADMSDACDEALQLAEIVRRTTATLSPVSFGPAEKAVERAQAAAAKSADELGRRAAE